MEDVLDLVEAVVALLEGDTAWARRTAQDAGGELAVVLAEALVENRLFRNWSAAVGVTGRRSGVVSLR